MYRYSLLIFICLLASFLIYLIYQLKIVFDKAWIYTALITFVSMIIFNTYLTALPIVVYNMNSIIGVKIITFPVEDFGYLVVALIILPALFDKLSNEERNNSKKSTKR
jgi:lycopene cyclase domain-containing protein